MASSTGAGKALSSKNIKRIKRQLSDAAAFVRSREVTQSVGNITFNELIATALKELVGDDTASLRTTLKLFDGGKEVDVSVNRARVHGRVIITELDRINAIENTIGGLIRQLKKTDPNSVLSALSNTNSAGTNVPTTKT